MGDLFYSKNGEIQESHHTVAREGEQGQWTFTVTLRVMAVRPCVLFCVPQNAQDISTTTWETAVNTSARLPPSQPDTLALLGPGYFGPCFVLTVWFLWVI